ncbi:MAG: ABC transporter substrate-binding protein [Treponema sp.]|nr:ABC transporter substrate-binding protein [Treponema sp.]
MNGKQKLAAVFLAALVLAAAGCVKGGSNAPAGGLKIINVGTTNDAPTLSPLASNNTMTDELSRLIFLPLVGIDENLDFVYRLAESVTTDDNVNFTIRLRKNIAWTDGTPSTADDVIFSLNALTNPVVNSYNPSVYNIIEGTDEAGFFPAETGRLAGALKADDYTLTVKTKFPVTKTIFLIQVANAVRSLPAHLLSGIPAEKLKTDEFWQKLPVSNGPFLFKEQVPSQYLSFEANPGYFLGRPKIDALNFKILSGAHITAQLESGEIDMNFPGVGHVPNDDYDRVQGFAHVRTEFGPSKSMQILFYNVNVIDNVAVRQAMDLAIDREGILRDVLKGSAYISKTPVTNLIQYWNEDAARYAYDPEKARQLLAESGWDLSKRLVFYVPTGNVTRERICILIAESFKAVGLNVAVEKMDFPTSLARVQGRDFDIGIVGVPEQPYNAIQSLKNLISWTNFAPPRWERLAEIISSSVDEEELRRSYLELQQILADNVPVSGLYSEYGLSAVNTRVTHGILKERGALLDVEQWDVR